MIAILALGAWYFGKHIVQPGAEIPFDQHHRAKGVLGARSHIGYASERAVTKQAKHVRVEPAPELRRVLHNPLMQETPENRRKRKDRLYEAMPDGPIGFARGKVDRDRDLNANRLPYMHPGLTRIGGHEHRHSQRGEPLVR